MSLRIVPSSSHTSSYTHIQTTGAPSAPGLHDTLRAGVGPASTSASSTSTSTSAPAVVASAHPLESRLANWEATRTQLRMEMLRRTYGMAEPIRRQMELKIVRDGQWRPLALGGGRPSVQEEILTGRDEVIDWEDVYAGEENEGLRAVAGGVQEEMERKLKI
ncbi:proteasome maturation factor UMP1-domain-containing protein [Coniochaeta sp. 2T2.1]|nr:proteasome maturation factor UMP1-domain-containing protein [Coniochaeta sp. 2T2.1]